MSKTQTAANKAPAEFVKPSYYPRAVARRILVRIMPFQEVSKGGIFIPEQVRNQASIMANRMQVVSMGAGCYKDPYFFGEQVCKPGDFVMTGQYIGHSFQVEIGKDKTGVDFPPDPAEEQGTGGKRTVRCRWIYDSEVCGLADDEARNAVISYLD